MQSTNEGAPLAGGTGKAIRMAPKIAYRNLIHDKVSLFVTLIGIVFAVILVSVQSGLFLGARGKIAAVIDRVDKTDLWVVPFGTKSFDDPSLLTGREKFALLSTPGVASVEEMVVSFAQWRKPNGGKKSFILVGTDWANDGLRPWNLAAGSVDELTTPNSVAIDANYFEDLGVAAKRAPAQDGMNVRAEINGQTVQVAAVTQGIRSFTTMPYVFTSIERARSLTGASVEQATYQLVKIVPGTDIETVRARILKRLPDTEVLNHAEFRKRSIRYWLFNTGAGGALLGGLGLGVIVGIVIVAQTLYANTKDHLNEFATLRALGASASYIHAVILTQALLSAVLGFVIGYAMTLGIVALTKKTTLTIVITPQLTGILFALTLVMCTVSAIAAILKVTRIDPAGVFSR
ncbi:MAG: FtsX-like permease family protein [Hyphomicrobium sp.]